MIRHVLAVAAIYIIAAWIVFRLRNPHLTETQLLLNAPRAILFK